MNIVCIGGGSAGLYFAISMKLRDPSHDITVIERNRPYDTFGWGVVFSDETLDNLWDNDEKSAAQIVNTFAHWDDIDVHYRSRTVTSGGHGFSGLARKRLLNILQKRAEELGVRLVFNREVESLEEFRNADLIVASDGINSRIRATYKNIFKPDIKYGRNKFVWLGTRKIFRAFTFIFEKLPEGWIWAHAYRFNKTTSTFIIECQEETWRNLGLDRLSVEDGISMCERIFARYLNGSRLLNNATHVESPWSSFPIVRCEKWWYKNIVLMGDSAHSAHFSVGSGTKLALEDAIDLATLLHQKRTIRSALKAYQDTRSTAVLRLQNAARNSKQWFETVPRYTAFEPEQFAYSLLTRSQRVSHENLRIRDQRWLEKLEVWFAGRAGIANFTRPVPPMFTPLKLRSLTLHNRIVVSPMAMYSAADGTPNDFHLVHWGTRAGGGAGLLFTEMTCVTPDGRISPGCCGMYKEEHVVAWTRIVRFVHESTEAKIGLQLGHSGPKGSTKVGWEGGDDPLTHGNWHVLAPSAVRWREDHQLPRAMTRDDMIAVKAAFVRATEMAEACGFDIIELHCAHGYLLSAFITPLLNKRNDQYGGSLENRLRYPLEVFSAMRAVWPDHKPMSVRISATDWMGAEGVTPNDAVEIAHAFRQHGADIIDVSAGQTSSDAKPVYGRMFQTPFADQIRNSIGVPVMAVGNIYEIDHVNSIIAAGRADLCCLARPHLSDPYWTLHAAVEQGFDVDWPPQYLPGRDQLVRLTERRKAAEAADVRVGASGQPVASKAGDRYGRDRGIKRRIA